MYNKNISVFLDSRGHANLDSFPLRYGIHYQYSKTLDLYDCSNWLKDEKFVDTLIAERLIPRKLSAYGRLYVSICFTFFGYC